MTSAIDAAVRAAVRNVGRVDLGAFVKPFNASTYFTQNFKDIWWLSAPTNIRPLRGKVELHAVYDLIRAEGLPLVPCPRPAIILELMHASDASARRGVLERRSSEVVGDCEDVFERLIPSATSGEFARFAIDAATAFKAGAWASAQAMASTITTTVLDDLHSSLDKTWRAAKYPKKGSTFPEVIDSAPPYEFWVLAPLWHAYENANDGDLEDKWGRHSSVHEVSDVHYNVPNAVISLMFVAALLDFVDLGTELT